MINHSFIYRPNDEPIGSDILAARRLQLTNHTEDNQEVTSYGPMDELEGILQRYHQELEQDSTSNFNCDQQLITRLFDSLIPAYPTDERRSKLEELRDAIISSQKKRLTQQTQQRNELYAEIHELQSSIITRSIEKKEEHFQTQMTDPEWKEIDDETKELHQLIQLQNQQIKYLIEILPLKRKCLIMMKNFLFEYLDLAEVPIDQPVEANPPPMAPRIPPVDERYLCPYCNQHLSDEDELGYIEHLSACFNEMNNIF